MALVSRITRAYSGYFEKHGQYRRRLLIEKVRRDHPSIFGEGDGTKQSTDLQFIEDLIRALRAEIVAARQLQRPLKLIRLQYQRSIDGKHIHSCHVELSSDEDVILNEGVLMQLGPVSAGAAVLSFDTLTGILFFECDVRLNVNLYYLAVVNLDAILAPLIGQLEKYRTGGLKGIAQRLKSRRFPVPVAIDFLPNFPNLDSAQRSAAENALRSDVSFLWGPPGTGKSHCLSAILGALLNAGERTLVVSMANVAVDQLLAKTLDLQDELKLGGSTELIERGKVARIGYITEAPLIRRFDNAPADLKIVSLLRKIREVQQRVHQAHSQATKAELTAEKRALSRELTLIQKERIEQANLVFATATKAIIDSIISETSFDNLVIDEASMVAVPYLFALVRHVKKRVVIAGDFMQLSPIALSQTQLSDKYLKADLFSIAGINTKQKVHDALRVLSVNRRANEAICGLYNAAFYDNIMKVHRTNLRGVGDGVAFIPLSRTGAELTESNSRRNPASREVIVAFILRRLESTSETIGIVAPYRAQVNDYKKRFLELGLSKTDQSRLKIGTVHTFQGSEADTIVFDIVDTVDVGAGRLFHQEQGERLINVAVSRARDNLFVFGDLEVLYKSNHVSPRVLRVLNAIKLKVSNHDSLV